MPGNNFDSAMRELALALLHGRVLMPPQLPMKVSLPWIPKGYQGYRVGVEARNLEPGKAVWGLIGVHASGRFATLDEERQTLHCETGTLNDALQAVLALASSRLTRPSPN